jgi:S-adenosylmethionine:tRNA-ribosyltransferase-isomerase (queuine synthetase)
MAELDLGQFVSDYYQMCRDNGERIENVHTTRVQILEMYAEATDIEPTPDQRKSLLDQIEYFLG